MRRINATVPGELVARPNTAGLNASEVTRDALAQRLEQAPNDEPVASKSIDF